MNVKDWGLGDHYKVRRFSVARGDKNRMQSNALVFQNTRDGMLQELNHAV